LGESNGCRTETLWEANNLDPQPLNSSRQREHYTLPTFDD
jgi:hypothetical protein